VIAASRISERWEDVLRAMYRHNQTAPEVMRYFRVVKVDGRTLTLATDQEVYFQRINPYPEKKQVIAKALYDVFHEKMLITVLDIHGRSAVSRDHSSDDPLLSAASELGAKNVRKVRKTHRQGNCTTDERDEQCLRSAVGWVDLAAERPAARWG
jgi:hypothetical protein